MNVISKRRLLLMLTAFACIMALAVAFAIKFDNPLVVMGSLAVMVIIATVISAVTLLLTSTIEWLFFKRQNIFKNWLQVYAINVTSLIVASFIFYIGVLIVIVASRLIPAVEVFMENMLASLILALSYVTIFLIIKLRRIKNITQDPQKATRLIVFNVIFAIPFNLLILLLFSYGYFIYLLLWTGGKIS